jgi:hypothetical protein
MSPGAVNAKQDKKASASFLEKKKQKTFGPCGRLRQLCQRPQEQSFFCFFFVHKKEVLAFLISPQA